MSKTNRYSHYNLDRLESIITIAILGESDSIYVSKKIVKLAKQMLKAKGLYEKIKIKTI